PCLAGIFSAHFAASTVANRGLSSDLRLSCCPGRLQRPTPEHAPAAATLSRCAAAGARCFYGEDYRPAVVLSQNGGQNFRQFGPVFDLIASRVGGRGGLLSGAVYAHGECDGGVDPTVAGEF